MCYDANLSQQAEKLVLCRLIAYLGNEIGLPSSSVKGEFTVEDAKEFFETNVDALSVDLQLRHAKTGKKPHKQMTSSKYYNGYLGLVNMGA